MLRNYLQQRFKEPKIRMEKDRKKIIFHRREGIQATIIEKKELEKARTVTTFVYLT